MPENNGSGRLDRIEILLEALAKRQAEMIEHHDVEFKKLLTWQVLMQDKMDKWQAYMEAESRMRKDADKTLDERVDKLVVAIGELVRRMDAQRP